MMFAFTSLWIISLLVSLAHAGPLNVRDVFSPHIIKPDANTVWPVGTKQTVTWETKDIPPDSQLTNPNGKVVLGHLGPTGGLNLELDHPLAQNFKLRLGKVQITVPNVPPRDDYLIVLFGDSGNTSPSFAITRITGGSNTTTTGAHTSSSSVRTTTKQRSLDATSSSSTLITEPIPITGTTITGGETTLTDTPTSTTVDVPSSVTPSLPTQTAPSSSLTQTPSTSTTETAPPSTTSTSAAGSYCFNMAQTLSSIGVASLLLTLLI